MKTGRVIRQMIELRKYYFPSKFVPSPNMNFPIDETFAIATKNGFYVLSKGNCKMILAGEYYGIAKVNHCRIFLFQKGLRKGRIWDVTFNEDYEIVSRRVVIRGLSHGTHQIDFYQNHLVVVDTYNNMILEYKVIDDEICLLRSSIINGRLAEGRLSKNYCHFNSIFIEQEVFSLLAHNETKKTGRQSAIWTLSKENLEVEKKILTGAGNAHNIVRIDDDWLLLDSLNNQAILGDEVIEGFQDFIRGMSVIKDYALIGGSEMVKRANRNSATGSLYIVDIKQRKIVCRFPFAASVQEIRCLTQPDKCTGIYDVDNL